MKKQNGITLIALVISIIVMLILAGVSIDAVVGDNGMISKAQDTVFLNSCAYLEDYFNQLYATCAIDGAEEGDTPLHTIIQNGYQHYFFSTSEGTCLKKNYMNDAGETQTLVLYLVKKEQLPEEIQAQLTGAEDLESRDYRKLRGCYGITSDLKAYYFANGVDSIKKLEVSDLNADSPDIMFADENSPLASAVNGGTAPIMNQGLKSIKTLTIDSVEELSILKDFSRFINLTTLYFENITIDNLVGIEGAANKITYIKFTNCNVENYSALNSLTNLTQLYLVQPAGMNEEIVRLGSIDKGIALGEFGKLQYFGIVGSGTYLNNTSKSYYTTRYEITDINSLSNFSETTKKAIKYMNLQNLQLTSIAALKEFTNVYFLRLEANALATFEGIENMSGLHYLIAPAQYSVTKSSYTLGLNEIADVSDIDALKYIYKNNDINSSLYYVDLRNNSKLKHVEYLSPCTGIRYCYLEGCTSLINTNSIGTVLGNCGVNYSISGTYGLEIIAVETKALSLAGKTMTMSEFEQLKNRDNLTHLSLSNISLTTDDGTKLTATTSPTFNEEVNSVLKTCKNLTNLQLNGLANLTSIDFVAADACTKLKELDLRNTGVTELAALNENAKSLTTLALTNGDIDIESIVPTINRCRKSGNYWLSNANGILLYNWNLWKQLENCEDLTHLIFYGQSTSSYTINRTLDLTKTSLQEVEAVAMLCDVYLPSTMVSIYTDYCKNPIFAENSDSMLAIELCDDKGLASEAEWEETIKSIANCSNLSKLTFRTNLYMNLDHVKYLSNLTKLETFQYVWWGDQKEERTHLGGVSELVNLKKIYVHIPKLNDISNLNKLEKLENATFINGELTDISVMKNWKELKSLTVHNNRIIDVYPLMSCTKLETLNIQNNALTDFGYYKNDAGQSVGYEVMDVFYDLNHAKQGSLKNLYISGNTFDDTEILLDLTWEGRNGF